MLSTVIDYAIFPLCGVFFMAVARLLQLHAVPNLLVTPIIVGPFAALVAWLERVRPERPEHKQLDLPLFMEAAHFILNFEVGYGLALGACSLIERGLRTVQPQPSWPSSWPVLLQLFLAVFLYEGLSYWQHRLLHRFPTLWRFHALHHSGARLNLVRAIRFHIVDFATASFTAYLPLVLLGTPEPIITLLAVLVSLLGILQHSNLRMRTPVFMNWLVCTPAIHRHHHSRLPAEGNTNFANTLMIFDLLFGSYGHPDPVGPAASGIEDDTVPRRFWAQCVEPFRGRRAATP
jgi:sterol desaturase/sphingolipid hydroxylase (fatty acid hydroxylase superfamily)